MEASMALASISGEMYIDHMGRTVFAGLWMHHNAPWSPLSAGQFRVCFEVEREGHGWWAAQDEEAEKHPWVWNHSSGHVGAQHPPVAPQRPPSESSHSVAQSSLALGSFPTATATAPKLTHDPLMGIAEQMMSHEPEHATADCRSPVFPYTELESVLEERVLDDVSAENLMSYGFLTRELSDAIRL